MTKRNPVAMLIDVHEDGEILEMLDGTRWRVWPGDIPTTAIWLPTTSIEIQKIEHEFCSHALLKLPGRQLAKAIPADREWPVKEIVGEEFYTLLESFGGRGRRAAPSKRGTPAPRRRKVGRRSKAD